MRRRGEAGLAKTNGKGPREARQGENSVTPPANKRGRPPGKRSDPSFEPVTAYIRVETHKEVKIRLIREGNKDFSELVEDLLATWLKSHN